MSQHGIFMTTKEILGVELFTVRTTTVTVGSLIIVSGRGVVCMNAKRFGNLFYDSHPRIKGAEWILKHILHMYTQLPPCGSRKSGDIPAFEQYPSGCWRIDVQ